MKTFQNENSEIVNKTIKSDLNNLNNTNDHFVKKDEDAKEFNTNTMFSIEKPKVEGVEINQGEFTLEMVKEEAKEENLDNLKDKPIEMTYGVRMRIFVFFLLANIFLNYDTGVIPASLLELIKEVELDYKEQALIGSLVYLGLSFASLFVSLLFQKYGPAKVCAVALLLNTVCCFLFSLSKIKYVLFATRFMMGVCEAFIVIYGPVWVNNYSPPENSTRWMGILHSCTALGVMVGYLFAGIIINFFSTYLSWRFAVQIQGIAQIPIALYFYLENEKYINVETTEEKGDANNMDDTFISNSINLSVMNQDLRMSQNMQENQNNNMNINISNNINNVPNINLVSPQSPEKKRKKSITPHKIESNIKSEINRDDNMDEMRNKRLAHQFSRNSLRRRNQFDTRIDTIETSNLSKYCGQARQVLCNPLYISVALGLCSMYFIVTGIQFWMTSYLIDILGNNPIQVVIIFSAVSITAPLAGVIVGGTFADKYGGYKGKNTLKALKLCLAFGVVAFVFSFPIGFLYSLVYIIVLLWTFLFFGAAIVPVGTGIMVSSVRKDCQATSSSISQLIFNFFGYFMSPILTGIIMDSYEDKYEGYKWGMRLIFWWAIFAVIFMGGAWIFAYRKYKKGNKDDVDLIEDEMNQNMNDLMKLEIMRRMALNVK